MFINRGSPDYTTFELALTQYVAIVEPFIRSLWALESSTANAADVYVFWLATASHIRELFDKDRVQTGIPLSLAEEVIGIFNDRHDEFFANDLYFTAFALDPRYPMSDFFLILETAGSSIVLPARNANLKMPHPRAYNRMKDYLKNMLKAEADRLQTLPDKYTNPVLKEIGSAVASLELKTQVEAFWRKEYPFNESAKDKTALEWWSSLIIHPKARVLAMLATKIFSILVNSMPDERTGSTFTWLNSALCGSQHGRTVVDMVQISQWYGIHKASSPRKASIRPTVKFRDIDQDLLRRLMTGSSVVIDDEGITMNAGSAHGDSGSLSDDEDSPSDSEDDGEAGMSSEPCRAPDFKLGDTHIDLYAPALKDMLSLTPAADTPFPSRSSPSIRQPSVPVAADWDW
ncbi:hypothetical protein DENSPDRAFT_789582 [Dentipellis sp. KUC8613]|nr:hypothetical protein DENSPDRAFT_789582 [Dentipellis sp. KUC8613]